MKRNLFQNHLWHFTLASLAFLAPLIFWMVQIIQQTGGVFIYPVDDTYIHLQVAKNLSLHGTWGVNPGEFGSASSSLLYTLLLAGCMKFAGPAVYLPLVINMVAGLVLLYVVQQWLRRQGVASYARLFILLLLVFITPLPVLALSGMEHTLQVLFSFLFLSSFCDWLDSADEEGRQKLPWSIVLYAALMVLVRYEGLFLLAAALLALLFRKQYAESIKLFFLATLPLLVFGIYSLAKGSYFFPNSLMVKSDAARFSLAGALGFAEHILVDKLTFAEAGITQVATQRLLLLLPLLLLFFYRQIRYWKGILFFTTALFLASLLQLSLADTGKFYRYEAYLIFHALLLLCLMVYKYGRHIVDARPAFVKAGLVVCSFILLFPVVLRSMAGFSKAQRASINIYEQQYQMARLLQSNFKLGVVAANDIGAISYFTTSYILDLWGLGAIEVAKSKKEGYWNAAFIDGICKKKNTDVVMIYESWLRPALPTTWKKVATWQVFNNVVTGDDFVSFYVVDKAKEMIVKQKLQQFTPSLPKTVSVVVYP